MDWSKAKTYLIVTFLLLDLLLGYQWWTISHQASVYVDSFADEVATVKDLLAAEHIQLQAEIPKDTPTLAFLRAGYKTVDLEKVSQIVLEHPKPVEIDDPDRQVVEYQGDNGELLAMAPGSYKVSWNTDAHISVDTSKKSDVSAKVDTVLGSKVWNGDAFKSDYQTIDTDGTGVIHFTMQYQGYPIFPAELEIELNRGKIIGYQETALDVTEEEGMKKRQVLSAISALRSLATSLTTLSKNNKTTVEIKDIRLGYYGKSFNADGWYLTPMWRFVASTNTFYVNAITGEVESIR